MASVAGLLVETDFQMDKVGGWIPAAVLWGMFLCRVACRVLSPQKQALGVTANRQMHLTPRGKPGGFMKVSSLPP